jgi:hypothetical protein
VILHFSRIYLKFYKFWKVGTHLNQLRLIKWKLRNRNVRAGSAVGL